MERLPQRPELPLIGRPLKEVKQVKEQHVEDLMDRPFVNGVGIGMMQNEDSRQFALRVYLRFELTPEQQEAMPQELDGVPIMYQVVGEIQALGATAPQRPNPRAPQG